MDHPLDSREERVDRPRRKGAYTPPVRSGRHVNREAPLSPSLEGRALNQNILYAKESADCCRPFAVCWAIRRDDPLYRTKVAVLGTISPDGKSFRPFAVLPDLNLAADLDPDPSLPGFVITPGTLEDLTLAVESFVQ